VLDLGEASETAEEFVNGMSAGVRIAAPYRFGVSALFRESVHSLALEVTNTLVLATPDFMFSRMGQLEPSGLLAPVRLYLD
jgi:hypothetical protein